MLTVRAWPFWTYDVMNAANSSGVSGPGRFAPTTVAVRV
jgi:hypothetical protein